MFSKKFSIFVFAGVAAVVAVAVAIGAGGPYATQAAARISAVVAGTYNPAIDTNGDGFVSDPEALDAAITAIAARGGVRPLASATPAPTLLPSATPVPPATPETPLPAIPSATPTPGPLFLPQVLVGQLTKAYNGTACAGFDPALWHPATNPVTGCAYGYETGDPPPAWLTGWLSATGRMPLMFMHTANTPGELANKPASMKGFCFACSDMQVGKDGIVDVQIITPPSLPGAQAYAVLHVAANPIERGGSGLHSYQAFIWYAGAMGYYDNGWQDSGVPKYIDDGGSRAYTDKFDAMPSPRVRVGDGPAQANPFWEQWYFAPLAPWAPTFAVTIGDAPVAYGPIERGINAGWITETHMITDTTVWPLTGGHGGTRNGELIIYADSIPANLVGAPFYHNQFGTVFATMAACQAGNAAYRGVTYANACGEAYISTAFYNAVKAIPKAPSGPPFSAGQFIVRTQVQHDTAGASFMN